jgi:hypothetical protein
LFVPLFFCPTFLDCNFLPFGDVPYRNDKIFSVEFVRVLLSMEKFPFPVVRREGEAGK